MCGLSVFFEGLLVFWNLVWKIHTIEGLEFMKLTGVIVMICVSMLSACSFAGNNQGAETARPEPTIAEPTQVVRAPEDDDILQNEEVPQVVYAEKLMDNPFFDETVSQIRYKASLITRYETDITLHIDLAATFEDCNIYKLTLEDRKSTRLNSSH